MQSKTKFVIKLIKHAFFSGRSVMACQVETKSNEVLKPSNTAADKENLEATEEPVAKKPKRQPRLAWVNFTILFLAILSYHMYTEITKSP